MQYGGAGVHSGLMRIRHLEKAPTVHPEAYVAPTAVLSGDVRIGRGVRLWDGLDGLHERYTLETVTVPSGATHMFFTR